MAPPILTLTLPDLAWRRRRTVTTDASLGATAAGSQTPLAISVDGAADSCAMTSLWPLGAAGRSPTGWTYTDEDGSSRDQPAWVAYESSSVGEVPARVANDPTSLDLGDQGSVEPTYPAYLSSEAERVGDHEMQPGALAVTSVIEGGYDLAGALPPASDGPRSFAPLSSTVTARPANDWPQAAWPSAIVWEKPSLAPVWPTAALWSSNGRTARPDLPLAAAAATSDCAADPASARPSNDISTVVSQSAPAPGHFADYEESLRAQVYGCQIAGDTPLAAAAVASTWATPNWHERTHVAPLRLLTDFASTTEEHLGYYTHSAPFSAPADGVSLGGLDAWLSTPAQDSHFLSPFHLSSAANSTSLSPLSAGLPHSVSQPLSPATGPVSPFAGELPTLPTLRERRRKRSASDRTAPYPSTVPPSSATKPTPDLYAPLEPTPSPVRLQLPTARARPVRSKSLSTLAPDASTAVETVAAVPTEWLLSTFAESSPEPLSQSTLAPAPKKAKSAWQLFLADAIEKNRAGGITGPNIAQLTKDSKVAYQNLDQEAKHAYQQKAQEERTVYAAELLVWQRSLTRKDIQRENDHRAKQRRNGKSSAKDMKDPNAPAKPLSPFFVFLRAVRQDSALRAEVFQGETSISRQSKLAGDVWKNLPADSRAIYDRQAETMRDAYKVSLADYESTNCADAT